MKLVSILLLVGSNVCMAQHIEKQLITSSGLSGTQGNQIVHTVGEPVVGSLSKSSVKVNQGFLQVVEVKKIQKEASISDQIEVWPNPAQLQLFVKTKDIEGTYSVFNSLQQEVASGMIRPSSNTTIDISAFQQGMYFLHVVNKNNKTEVYQIIKK